MIRKATAVWQGSLKEGSGKVSTQSDALTDAPYSFGTRFEEELGTNPEELIAAAHASCFSMAISSELQKAKLTPTSLTVNADVTLEKGDDAWNISKVHLDVSADISNADEAVFQKAAQTAKENCPVSKLLKAEITMTASLGAPKAEAKLANAQPKEVNVPYEPNDGMNVPPATTEQSANPSDHPTTDEAGTEPHQSNGMPHKTAASFQRPEGIVSQPTTEQPEETAATAPAESNAQAPAEGDKPDVEAQPARPDQPAQQPERQAQPRPAQKPAQPEPKKPKMPPQRDLEQPPMH